MQNVAPFQSAAVNAVCIIESLREKDTRTGSELYEKLGGLEYNGYKIRRLRSTADTKDEFKTRLVDIRDMAINGNVKPIIHLEMHGNEKGLELASGDFIEWDEFLKSIQSINVACKNNLGVSLAACSTGSMWRHIELYEHAPVWGFVAPLNEVYDRDVRHFYSFYEVLFKSGDALAAIAAMNDQIVNPERFFRYYNSEEIFEFAWRTLWPSFNTPEAFGRRIDKIVAMIIRLQGLRREKTIERLISEAKIYISDDEELKAMLKNSFLGRDVIHFAHSNDRIKTELPLQYGDLLRHYV